MTDSDSLERMGTTIKDAGEENPKWGICFRRKVDPHMQSLASRRVAKSSSSERSRKHPPAFSVMPQVSPTGV
jgi:hypothetical protein